MSKCDYVQQVLERRIRHGDYLIHDLPGERELARDMGVSRMTARKAVLRLVQDGMLQRLHTGRLRVRAGAAAAPTRIAFLVPTVLSADVERWRLALHALAGEFHAVIRTVLFLHWDDPLVSEALNTFDAVVLYPSCEAIPPHAAARLQSSASRILVLDQDLTDLGLPSICPFPPAFIARLLDQLLPWSDRGVDCFNIQTIDPVIEVRIRQWNLWRAAHRLPGQLLGQPIRAYGVPLEQAYAEMLRAIDDGQLSARALLCTTAPAALAGVRALHDRGRRVGRDIGVCVINDEGFSRYLTPSLTSLRMPDPAPYLRLCLEWLTDPKRPWTGSLLVQPLEPTIFAGESTGRA